jgi:hypothetical protein
MLYDTSYRVPYDLEPGQMVYCPTNAPHRVENEDCLNISLTLDFLTEPIRRAQIVTLANGLLRHRFGWQPHSRSTQGPSYWAKAVLQKALRNGSLDTAGAACSQGSRVPARPRRPRRGRRSDHVIAGPRQTANIRGRLR